MILFLRKLVADRFRSGFAVVTGIDLEPGKEFYLLARDMTVSILDFFPDNSGDILLPDNNLSEA